ncbi:putative urea hydro-lyase/cyanamide hydratase [Clohesyomyces aquaticus]|uniref:Putative urea hydro-lyase/cyanamide hydratase n=1 Tax=Clohesyomyces aquaticus TaxID=1231657 RepID=A0A1Y2A2W8_9PLEO|nr:putative urea hydro-lyase/cyanamide hydratase [Clohesyomyces aquaticus]
MSDDTNKSELAAHGWTSVPRAQSRILSDVNKSSPAKLSVDDVTIPDSAVAKKTHSYAKEKLPDQTFKHSMRVFYYGSAIVKFHLPEMEPLLETYFLTCMLHDIGTTQTNLNATRMSFEFYGGFLALNLLQKFGAPKSQAESVCEAIIRHQDLGDTGRISSVGQLIQLATVFDNIGINPFLIHSDTIESVAKAFPRNKWSGCFAATIREEIALKPWCHTTAIEQFAEKVEGNHLMEPWE